MARTPRAKRLSAVYRTDQRFGMTYVIDVLLGKADDRIGRNGHDRLAVFGIGKDMRADDWKGLFRQLTASGYLVGDSEGHGTLLLTDRARPLLRGEETFAMRRVQVQAKAPRDAQEAKAANATSAARRPSEAATMHCSRLCARCARSWRAKPACRPTSSAMIAR